MQAGANTVRQRNLATIMFKPVAANTNSSNQFLTVARRQLNLPLTGVGVALYSLILGQLWKTRNLHIFEDRHFTLDEVIIKAIVDARLWHLAQLENYKSRLSPKSSPVATTTPHTTHFFIDTS